MEDNRKFSHMNDRDYLRFFVFHEWLLTLIVNFGTFCYIVHILYLNPKEAPLGAIQHYFNIIFAPGLLIWFWWLELHLITSCSYTHLDVYKRQPPTPRRISAATASAGSTCTRSSCTGRPRTAGSSATALPTAALRTKSPDAG